MEPHKFHGAAHVVLRGNAGPHAHVWTESSRIQKFPIVYICCAQVHGAQSRWPRPVTSRRDYAEEKKTASSCAFILSASLFVATKHLLRSMLPSLCAAAHPSRRLSAWPSLPCTPPCGARGELYVCASYVCARARERVCE